MAKKLAVKTILVCDDSPETRLLLKSVLTNDGFAVLEAENGLVAQALAEAHIPNLIIMDVVMPGQDGITTIVKLAANPETSGIPIIIMTGKTAITKLIDHDSLQVKAIFEKPFFMKDLRAKIAEIFND
ncbi:response regulator [bacterium]|nr:response regulator [bacterium]MBU4133861.1 response regulator [bacterium]